jgi:hypothetical protein
MMLANRAAAQVGRLRHQLDGHRLGCPDPPPMGRKQRGIDPKVQVVGQLGEKPPAVVVTVKDLRPAIATAGDMIDGVRKINAWRAGRVWKVPRRTFSRKPESA